MRACVVHGAGDLRVQDRPIEEPGPDQVRVRIALGGICGSDLHYYHRGAVGDFAVREPMVLGHEVVGTVAAVGPGVDIHGGGTGPAVGDPVAVHPATPCGQCRQCRADRRHLCPHTRYLGSAAAFPHVQGGFAEQIVVPAAQIRVLPTGLALELAVLAEPLSVALHAVARAGDVTGRDVLVTGAGPIGCLVVAALSVAGAGSVLASDVQDAALQVAVAVGATGIVRADRPDDPAWPAEVDVAIEASGTAAGLDSCLRRVTRGGVVVQLGLLPPGDVPFAGNLLVTREIDLRGAFRFDHEFDRALELLAGGLPVGPVVTHVVALAEAVAAFELAGDRSRASKVLLDLR